MNEATTRVREMLGEQKFQREWDIGRSMNEEQAIALAMHPLESNTL